MAHGAEAGLRLVAQLADLEELKSYQPFFATRADLLRRVERFAEATLDYERALLLAKTEPEKRYMQKRLNEMRALTRT
jgi:RNA polymerase sigma-70 factor (ECF subfamily)